MQSLQRRLMSIEEREPSDIEQLMMQRVTQYPTSRVIFLGAPRIKSAFYKKVQDHEQIKDT